MKKQNKVEKNPQQDTSDVIFKDPPKRKVSLKYKVWLVALLFFFTVFFLILVFYVRIFEKFDRAKVIEVISDGSRRYITYVVDDKEYTTYYSFRDASSQRYSGRLEYILYQVSDPTKTFIHRDIVLYPLLIVDILCLLGLIPLTIYEVKKGFIP